MTTTIDTLSYVKRLEAAGVERKTAEAHAEAINANVLPQLATKADLRELASDIKQEMWKQSIGILLGGLMIGGFLIRFLK